MLESLAAALADRYTIEREIGAGGMGTVYLPRELKHDRQVALKVLRPEIASHLGVVRFLNEVKVTAKLDHPHILTLIDSGEADEYLWYVQPYVRGESLRAKLDRERQLSVEEAIAIARQIASALHHAHQKGVIHRDIKPANILIHEVEAMVAEFGSALQYTPSGGFPAAEPPRKSRALLFATVAGVVVLAGAGAALMLRSSGPAVSVGRSEQITADPGLEIQPTISPDGKLLAYA